MIFPRRFFEQALSTRELCIGPLKLELRISPEHFLAAVLLPEAPPAGFRPAHLALALAELAQWPLSPAVSEGEARFRKLLASIPAGTSATYGAVALTMGSSPRAVASRCAANRFLLRIPCHRVVAKDGIGGYQLGAPWKATLLEFEQELARREQ